MIHSLEKLVSYVRARSLFYASHLISVPDVDFKLEELPLIDPALFWNDSRNLDTWPVLTDTPHNALIFKTGGSTSQGKLVVYTRDEWHYMVSAFGQSLTEQLSCGDRVANLFFAGDLYASFLFIHTSLAHVGVPITEYPFTGEVDPANLMDAIDEHRINVLAGVPAQLLRFAAWLGEHRRVLPDVTTVLYGGESLFAAQLPILEQVFPNARIASIGYACVDAGLVGASTRDCRLGEHRAFDGHTWVEIVDEQTGEVIDECGRSGLLVISNLTRSLMPMLRYPVGDRASWCEPSGTARRKFVLQGRSAQSQRVRVGIASLFAAEISEIVQRLTGSLQWQVVIQSVGHKDCITLKWVDDPDCARALAPLLRDALISHYPAISRMVGDDQLDLEVLGCSATELRLHPRSGKCMPFLDLREYSAPLPERTP